MREGWIPDFSKDLKTGSTVRLFNFDLSVFADWMRDNEEIIDEALVHDKKYWKLNRFNKDNLEAEETILNLIKTHWDMLNAIFLSYAAKGNFPTLM